MITLGKKAIEIVIEQVNMMEGVMRGPCMKIQGAIGIIMRAQIVE